MKLSELINELQKFVTLVEDPEVVFYNGDVYSVLDVTTVELQQGTAVEISGELL